MKLWERFKRKPQGRPHMTFTIRVMVGNGSRRPITVWCDGETAEVSGLFGERVVLTSGCSVDIWPYGKE